MIEIEIFNTNIHENETYFFKNIKDAKMFLKNETLILVGIRGYNSQAELNYILGN